MQEHPFGREMLRQLLAAGLRPEAILQEESDLAKVEHAKFLQRIEGHTVAPSITSQTARHDIPILAVAKHDDESCLSLIRDLDPALMVLGGTRIVRGEMLAYPAEGVLNSHPGLLPECRGSASPAWSIYHDIPIGSSCHFCTPEIDQGDLVGRRQVPVLRGERYQDLCHKTLTMAGTLMTEALVAWADGSLERHRQPQGESRHPTFKNMPDELLVQVHRKLAEQSYAHYED